MSSTRHVFQVVPRTWRGLLCVALIGGASLGAHAQSRPLLMEATEAADSDCSIGYPEEAMKNHQQGIVRLKFWVDTSGKASKIEVVESSKYPLLDNAAISAATCATFMPAIVDGKPAASWMAQSTKYDLTRRPAGRTRDRGR